jgi:hypothetical protein
MSLKVKVKVTPLLRDKKVRTARAKFYRLINVYNKLLRKSFNFGLVFPHVSVMIEHES